MIRSTNPWHWYLLGHGQQHCQGGPVSLEGQPRAEVRLEACPHLISSVPLHWDHPTHGCVDMAGRPGEQPGPAAWSPGASPTHTGPVHVLPPTLPVGLVSPTSSTNCCPFPARCSQNTNSFPPKFDQKFNVVQPPSGLNSWVSHSCAHPRVNPYIHPAVRIPPAPSNACPHLSPIPPSLSPVLPGPQPRCPEP